MCACVFRGGDRDGVMEWTALLHSVSLQLPMRPELQYLLPHKVNSHHQNLTSFGKDNYFIDKVSDLGISN